MTSEDAEIARNVRRELGKRAINSTMIDVSVKSGNITLSGRIMHIRDDKGANLRSEIDIVMKNMTRERLVRGFFDQMQYVVEHEDDSEREKNSRGRMRT
ncbi:MAG: BON domain-containing protein [Janthinobacterium lividum]